MGLKDLLVRLEVLAILLAEASDVRVARTGLLESLRLLGPIAFFFVGTGLLGRLRELAATDFFMGGTGLILPDFFRTRELALLL